MEVFALSFLAFAMAAAGMAVGLIVRGETLRGGCAGGVQVDGARVGCALCQGSCDRRRRAERTGEAARRASND